ncbi:MAG: ATP-binding cassette domain-containing protein [bacterium]
MPEPSFFTTTGLTVSYPLADAPALQLPALSIEQGERCLIAGATGAGKSTLLMVLLRLLADPEVRIEGEAMLLGQPLEQWNPATIGQRTGVVFQSPGDQYLAARVDEEIALGLRALGVTEVEIPARVAASLEQAGIIDCIHQAPSTLSGGQQQRLMLAAALARDPGILILDEPFSQLDPQAASDLAALLDRLCRERGLTLLLAEHRTELALTCVDRVLTLERGALIADGPCASIQRPARFARRNSSVDPSTAPPLVTLDRVRVQYPETTTPAFEGSLTIPRVAQIALVGLNGSGKSTLLLLLAGLLRPKAGAIRWEGKPPRVAFVPQDADVRLLGRTIREDLALSRASQESIASLTDRLALPPLDQPPLGSSKGQRQQIALASALLEAPDLLLLDEPTTGQDRAHIGLLLELLGSITFPVIVATHDLEVVRATADWVIVLEAGRVVAQGSPDHVLASSRKSEAGGERHG